MAPVSRSSRPTLHHAWFAGGPIEGSVFKCALKAVETALTDGTYAGVSFTGEETARLNGIFPGGVCDYSRPDQGRP
ncbi:DUF6351 family protein [Marinobacter sp. LV10R510-11A]|uniref:DUF6351 family protein n=1 Tax=Marinobacter sp. LV10R510-11A TaxID=1415568 RepID=UPI001D0D6B49